MKKNGFTLAEVLITLAIIGIVAVLTLPALNANTQEQQARTALKKMTNTFTQIAAMNTATAGFDYSGITEPSRAAAEEGSTTPGATTDQVGTLLRLFQERCSLDSARGNDLPSGMGKKLVDTAVYLRDGTAVYFNGANSISTGQYGSSLSDGFMAGIPVIFDTNGSKGPNKVSNCSKATSDPTDWKYDDGGNCSTKSKRVIKDQYMFRLRGNFVAPLGAASVWMMDDSQAGDVSDIYKFTPSGESGGDGEHGGDGTP